MKQTGQEIDHVGELIPKEQFITLHTGDLLILTREDKPGESAVYSRKGKLSKPAHISCTLKEVFDDVSVNDPIFFDDGKIEGKIEEKNANDLKIRILYAKGRGSKLKADKGINLPISQLNVNGLTKKDKKDLEFVAQNADVVNFSFVNRPEDVLELYKELDKYQKRINWNS